MRVYAKDGTWMWSQWLATVLRFPVNAYFAWDDPPPWVSAMTLLIEALGEKIQRRFSERDQVRETCFCQYQHIQKETYTHCQQQC